MIDPPGHTARARRATDAARGNGHGVFQPKRANGPALRSRRTGRSVASPPTEGDLATTLPKVFKIFSSVVAPATLVTGLLLYFGRMHATGFFRYLGVQYTVLDLTAQDYLVRSADGMIPPLVIAAGATLLAVWAHQTLVRVVPGDPRRRLVGWLAPLCALAGLLLVGLAVADTLTDGKVVPRFPEARGLGLSIGALLLVYAARLVRSLAGTAPGTAAVVTEWVAAFVLVSVGLFWAVGTYAVGVGRTRGAQLGAAPPDLYAVTLYSQKSLSLAAPGVTETSCQDPDAAYRFRYDGLRMVLQSGGQYLLLPAGWTPENGAALLIPRGNDVRLEFGGRPSGGAC